MDYNREQFMFTEKYRPHKIEDCILPDEQLKTFQQYVKLGQVQNMLLCGTAGVGKTSVAKALCEELDCDWIYINASEETGVDVLRTKIKQFATAVSFDGKKKVVILDEFDRASPAFQDAAKAFFEEFSGNCRFILTTNNKHKIIEPILSRMKVIEFKLEKSDKPKMAARFMQRVKEILAIEQVEYDEKVVAQLLMKYFPDYRRVLNELQYYSLNGKIDEGILANVKDVNIKDLMKSLKEKDFKQMRQWVVNNIDSEPSMIFRKIYDSASDYVKPQSIPNLVLLLADYGYKSSFCSDQEINLVAALTEMMVNLEYI